MARYIDADALNYVRVRIAHDDGTIGGYNAVVPSSEIKNAPTVDAEPVRHGKWIETEENHGFDNEVRNKALSCSVCRVAFRISDYAQIADFRYFPNCGARMDEK